MASFISMFLLVMTFVTIFDLTKCDYCNLALYKPTTSNCYNYKTESCMAVDGDLRQNSTFISCLSDNPWWQVDLEDVYKINVINITYERENINDISISTSQNQSSDGTLLNAIKCNSLPGLSNFCNDELYGRYVRLTKNLASSVLQIKEVQVYGEKDGICLNTTRDWSCADIEEDIEADEVLGEHCLCPCSLIKYNSSRQYTEAELQRKIDILVQEISIDKKSTSVSKRKLISAPDNRTSAMAVGSMGVIILSLLLLGIIAMDLSRLICSNHPLSFVNFNSYKTS